MTGVRSRIGWIVTALVWLSAGCASTAPPVEAILLAARGEARRQGYNVAELEEHLQEGVSILQEYERLAQNYRPIPDETSRAGGVITVFVDKDSGAVVTFLRGN
jgi:hypothetical protein